MATVTIGLSLVLSLGFAEGPVEVTVLDVDGFTTFSFPYLVALHLSLFQQVLCLVLPNLLSELEDLL